MAAISGIANFLGTSALATSDLENSFEAIVRQVGGTAPARTWSAGATVAVGDIMIPTTFTYPTSHRYRCVQISTGITGGTEPSWPTTTLATIADGGVTWQEDGQSPYATYPGNLNSANISSSAGFTNLQKAEPYALVPIQLSVDATNGTTYAIAMSPATVQVFALSVVFVSGGPITGGVIKIHVNGVTVAVLPGVPQSSYLHLTSSGAKIVNRHWNAEDGVGGSILAQGYVGVMGGNWGLQLGLIQDDVIAIDASGITATTPATDLFFVLWAKGAHVAR